MITEYDIYVAFRKAQAESKNRPYRIPKDWDKHFSTKMSQSNRESLTVSKKYFNTKWDKIDLDRFMRCGFELFKSFTYVQFFDQRVINLYIQKDKNLKRDMTIAKKEIMKSMKFIKTYMIENDIPSLSRYCMLEKNFMKVVIRHYIDNKVNKFLLVWLIKERFLNINDDDRSQIPYIVVQYREILSKLNNLNGFMYKLKERI